MQSLVPGSLWVDARLFTCDTRVVRVMCSCAMIMYLCLVHPSVQKVLAIVGRPGWQGWEVGWELVRGGGLCVLQASACF